MEDNESLISRSETSETVSIIESIAEVETERKQYFGMVLLLNIENGRYNSDGKQAWLKVMLKIFLIWEENTRQAKSTSEFWKFKKSI